MSNTINGIEVREPAPVRRVLVADNATVAASLKAAPGQWLVIGTGDYDRRGVLAQTGNRIRGNKVPDFYFHPNDGKYEIRISGDKSTRDDRTADIELFARWVPAGS